MRVLAFSVFGLLLLISPKVRLEASYRSISIGTILRQFRQEILSTLQGTRYRAPHWTSLGALFISSGILLWICGADLALSFSIAALVPLATLVRVNSTANTRSKELRSSWPTYIEQARGRMLTSARALPYILFDSSLATSTFLSELLEAGRREFENTGDLQRSLRVIRSDCSDETTAYVCNSISMLQGSASSQIDYQLFSIASTLRTRDSLAQESDARLAGVRTARMFILLIPAGMALAGVTFAGSLTSFTSSAALIQILGACVIIAACWYWSHTLMRSPKWPTLDPGNTDGKTQSERNDG